MKIKFKNSRARDDDDDDNSPNKKSGLLKTCALANIAGLLVLGGVGVAAGYGLASLSKLSWFYYLKLKLLKLKALNSMVVHVLKTLTVQANPVSFVSIIRAVVQIQRIIRHINVVSCFSLNL